MPKIFLIGVDGGGTKTKVRIETAAGELLGESTTGPGNIKTSVYQSWESIKQGIHKIIAPLGIELNHPENEFHAAMGMAGVEVATAREQFLTVPHPFKNLLLASDAHVACLGAHGGKDGCIIIIGTGVNGYQIEGDQHVQVAGWGFPHSDEGGGAWLGMEVARLTFKYLDGRLAPSPLLEAVFSHFSCNKQRITTWANQAQPANFGELAPLVIQFSLMQDPHALALMSQAGAEITVVGDTLLQRQQQKAPLPCVLLGGIAPHLLTYLGANLKARLVSRQLSPPEGAILMLKQTLHLEANL